MVRVILGGQWRGTTESWNSLKVFCEHYNAEVYTSYPQSEEWQLPFRFNSTINGILEGTTFEQTTHPHKERYIEQWSSLYNAYNFFNDMFGFEDNDIIVKLRNDLVYEPFQLEPKDNTICVPDKGWHEPIPTISEILCNDQILYCYNNVMKIYFNLPYQYKWGWRHHEAELRYGSEISIEEMIRTHLYQNNINLQTFKLNYNKI